MHVSIPKKVSGRVPLQYDSKKDLPKLGYYSTNYHNVSWCLPVPFPNSNYLLVYKYCTTNVADPTEYECTVELLILLPHFSELSPTMKTDWPAI